MSQSILSFLLLLSLGGQACWAFTTSPRLTVPRSTQQRSQQPRQAFNGLSVPSRKRSNLNNGILIVRHAGGFEWEDPTESFDQGVENPFKNAELLNSGEDGMKINPARLLGPRLSGSNLYLIGMMGSGKSSVGDKVARRK